MRRYVLLAAVLAAAVVGVGVAVGDAQQNGQTVTPIFGRFDIVRTKADETICRGGGGHIFRDAVDTFEGTFSGSDPRLNGHYVGHIHSIFDAFTGWGTDSTEAHVFDPATGRVTLRYTAMAIISPVGKADGFAVGKVSPDANLPEADFRANFHVEFEPIPGQFTLHGVLGAGSGANTAIVFGGPCIPIQAGPH